MKGRLCFGLAALVSCAIAGASFAPALAQVAIDHFDGADEWPLYAPGDLAVSNDGLTHIRVGYDMVFGATGVTRGYIDVDRVLFRGKPAHWVEWKFSAEEEGVSEGWPSFDLLILDKETGQLLARTAPSRNPRGDWGGPYSSIEVRDGELRRLTLSTTGEGKLVSSDLDNEIFDFGALGFVLPFLDVEIGQGFRLNTYLKSLGDSVYPFAIKVVGTRSIKDTSGADHVVLAMDALSPDRGAIITFYVSDAAPYFYGWDYRKVSDGSTLFRMDYRGFVDTTMER